jgi:hypothetical protein
MLSLKVPQIRTHLLEALFRLEAELFLSGGRVGSEVRYIPKPNISNDRM